MMAQQWSKEEPKDCRRGHENPQRTGGRNKNVTRTTKNNNVVLLFFVVVASS